MAVGYRPGERYKIAICKRGEVFLDWGGQKNAMEELESSE